MQAASGNRGRDNQRRRPHRGAATGGTKGPEHRPVTSVDVAREAGVSQATVARTFSSPQKVSEKTRGRVHAAAERIGYVPNAIASSLKSQRTNIVGAVVPAYGEYWQSILTEFSRKLADAGKQLLLFSFDEPEQVTDVLRSVQRYRLDGVILASATIGRGEMATMAATRVPTVTFNQPAAAGVIDSVSVDNETGTAQLADHLAELDCRTVLYVGGVASASTDRLRYQGAARALGNRGIACPYVEAGRFSYLAGYRIAAEITRRAELPEAVMVAGDELAFGVIDGLRDQGVRTPHDMLLTGFDGLPQASWAAYDLTTLVQPTSVLVNTTIDLLLSDHDRRDVPGREPENIVIEGTLRIGATTTRPKSAAEVTSP